MAFAQLSPVDRLVNRAVAALVRRGVGFSHMRVLEVRGRKSGTVQSLPVDLLGLEGRQYLVAPRGTTQWVRNAEVAGEVTLLLALHAVSISRVALSHRSSYLGMHDGKVPTSAVVP